MTADPGNDDGMLSVQLDPKVFAALIVTAAGRGIAPAELVSRWVQERLAHEAERRLGRERPQRPSSDA